MSADVRLAELDALPTIDFEITPESVGDDSFHASSYTSMPAVARAAAVGLGITRAQRRELRRVVLRACYVGVRDHARMTYTQGPLRWSGIAQMERDVADQVPPYCDCSSFATWAMWDASRYLKLADFVNGASWLAGYTGTMTQHGIGVPLADAQTADLIFYGDLAVPYHVAVYVGGGRVVSMGRQGAPEIVPVGPASQCRRFVL